MRSIVLASARSPRVHSDALGGVRCAATTSRGNEPRRAARWSSRLRHERRVTLLPPLIQQVDEKIVADQISSRSPGSETKAVSTRGFRPALADSWTWETRLDGHRLSSEPARAVARRHARSRIRCAVHVRSVHRLGRSGRQGPVCAGAHRLRDGARLADGRVLVRWRGTPSSSSMPRMRMLIVPAHLLANEPRATLQTSAFGAEAGWVGAFSRREMGREFIHRARRGHRALPRAAEARSRHLRHRARPERLVGAPNDRRARRRRGRESRSVPHARGAARAQGADQPGLRLHVPAVQHCASPSGAISRTRCSPTRLCAAP